MVKKNSTTLLVDREFITLDVVKLNLLDHIDPNQAIPELQKFFDDLYQEGIVNIVFNMNNVLYPNGNFIAMLVAETMLARRREGDLKLINLSETARSHLSIFTPLTYLTIGIDAETPIDELHDATPSLYAELLDYKEGESNALKVDASIDSLREIMDFISVIAHKAGLEKIELSKLKIAVYECCMNVIEHGYGYDTGHSIQVEAISDGKNFSVTIVDWGKPFDFFDTKPYNVDEAFHEKRRNGFGMYIIQQSGDDFKYCADEKNGNRLTIIKQLSNGKK